MTVLTGEDLQVIGCITPFHVKQEVEYSWGQELAGYTLRVGKTWRLIGEPGWWMRALIRLGWRNPYRWRDVDQTVLVRFGRPVLISSAERIEVPITCMAIAFGKSSHAREGVRCYITPLEPGWRGNLTIEVACDGPRFDLLAGQGICQLIFFRLAGPVAPYIGRYQDQTISTGRLL